MNARTNPRVFEQKDAEGADNAAISKAVEGLGKAFEEFKSANDQRLKEIETKGKADPLTEEKVEKLAKELADLNGLKGRLDKLETASARPTKPGDEKADEERKSFVQAMRSKRHFDEMEAKAVDADYSSNSTSGGVMIPEVIARDILKKVIDISPLRQIVRVTSVSTPNYERLVNERGAASGWAGESTTRSETGTPTVQRVTFTHGELYALPQASNWALNDLMVDVAGWLSGEVAEEFAFQEGVAIISGNGTNKPTGFLNGTPVSTGDEDSPARAFGTLQYVPTGKAGAFANSRIDSPPGDPGDVFITTAYKLKAAYRSRARWVMNKNTLATVMKFKDADGNYLWRPGLQAGQPSSLIGYAITEAEGMPDVGSNTFPVAFGDFYEGYELIDIQGMRMIRDDVTTKGFTKFYTSRRLGGKVVNDDAIKLIKCAAS